MTLDTLLCLEAEETGLLSDGDEPVLAVMGFVSQFGGEGSTQVWRQPIVGDDWATHFGPGNVFGVPASAGAVRFPWIDTTVPPGQILPPINILGTVVIAVEHDTTPLSYVGEVIDDVVSAFRGELVGLVEQAEIDIFNEAHRREQLNHARRAVAAAAKRKGFELIVGLLKSGFDPDDSSEPAVALFTNAQLNIDELTVLSHGQRFELDLRYVNNIQFPDPLDVVEFPTPDSVPWLPTFEIPYGAFHYRVAGHLELIEQDPEFAPLDTDPECMPGAGQYEISLPDAVRMVRDGNGGLVRFEFVVTTPSGRRVAYGRDVHHDPGVDHVLMSVTECANGRRVEPPWTISLAEFFESYLMAYSIPGVAEGDGVGTAISESGGSWTGSLDGGATIQVISRAVPSLH